MTVRSFLAVEVDPALRQALVRLQERLRSATTGVKWVEPENLHLTVRFLGEVPEGMLEAVAARARAVAAAVEPFLIGLRGVGAFPQPRAARVVWVGVQPGRDRLAQVAAGLEEELGAIGFPPERRPFQAHLTLGRVRQPHSNATLAAAIQETSQETVGQMVARELVLMRSDLTPRGPLYTVQARCPFQAGEGGRGPQNAK